MKRALAAIALGLAACARAPVPVTREAFPQEAERAEVAFGALKAGLLSRLSAAIGQDGPAGAISVCSTEALPLTEQIAIERGVEVGRTSFRLRNAKNAPRAWAAAHVASAENRPAYFDLGDRVGVLAPMPLGGLCVTCHGPREGLAPDVRDALAQRYPDDQAVDFQEGDLRGYFWAEVPKR